jgi:hypothetical protein
VTTVSESDPALSDPSEVFNARPRAFQAPTKGEVALRRLSVASQERLQRIRKDLTDAAPTA